ncbi:MAG: cob(I)yrinic acid a,c-diamide adenosyltransferase [Nitrosopumilus sp. H8]|nr:MAG: cob(I)yrinic acid a,c-diamide adenosyltransferase [Nitrosopumilus sp. H8]
MKIYTKTGDGGDTGLQGNLRISKSHPRIMAYGAVDEANSSIGLALAGEIDGDIKDVLLMIQNELFVVGADLSNPNTNDMKNRVTLEMVQRLESHIDAFESELLPLGNFILPGGSTAASLIHHARTVTRRAETLTVLLSETDEINSNCIKYLNRLSDLLFVTGRLANKRNGVKDVPWHP